MKWTVYRATSPSGKCYIGITSRKLEKRIAEHVNNKVKTKFNYALRKYKDLMQWEILITVDSEELAKSIETRLVDFHFSLKDCYNTVVGGGLPPVAYGSQNKRSKFSEIEVAYVLQLYSSGKSQRVISTLTGISKSQVANIIHGDQRRSSAVPRRVHSKLSKSDVEYIKNSSARNMDLAKQFNVSRATISSIWHGSRWSGVVAQSGHYGGLSGEI